MTSLLLWATKKNCVTLFLCVQFLRGKKRSIYRSKNHIPSPPWRLYFSFPCHTPKFTPHTPFLAFFCPFCIYFTLLTSIPPLSFLLFPSYFPLFSLPPFHIFPQNDMVWYFPGGGVFSYIYTPAGKQSLVFFIIFIGERAAVKCPPSMMISWAGSVREIMCKL